MLIDPTNDEQVATLTAEQRLQMLEIMMWDLIVYDTMVLIHGKDHGPRRAFYALGYGEPC